MANTDYYHGQSVSESISIAVAQWLTQPVVVGFVISQSKLIGVALSQPQCFGITKRLGVA